MQRGRWPLRQGPTAGRTASRECLGARTFCPRAGRGVTEAMKWKETTAQTGKSLAICNNM